MKAILYISQAQTVFDKKNLCLLAEKAAAQNATQGITGYLWFKKGQFIQYIEGQEQKLDLLMTSIANDSRHKILHQIEDQKENRRRFPEWNMRYFSNNTTYEIGLETILIDQLLLMNTAYKKHINSCDSLWRTVEKISKNMYHKTL